MDETIYSSMGPGGGDGWCVGDRENSIFIHLYGKEEEVPGFSWFLGVIRNDGFCEETKWRCRRGESLFVRILGR